MNVVEIFEYFNTMSPVSQAQAMVITGLQKRFMADMTQVRLNLMMWLYDLQQNEFAAEMVNEEKIMVKPLAGNRVIIMTAQLPMLI